MAAETGSRTQPSPPRSEEFRSAVVAWRESRHAPGERGAGEATRLAERLLASGEPLLAYDILREAVERHPAVLRLRQLLALSLLRIGATQAAAALLSQLRSEGHQDEETLGLAARVCKDLYLLEPGAERKQELLREAQQLYLRSYQATGGYWTGINAATLGKLLGAPATTELAQQVIAACRALEARAEPAAPERFWLRATMAEATLLLGEPQAAHRLYAEAVALAGDRYADIASARRNVRMLAEAGFADWGSFAPLFRLPKVAVFTGHMVDAPGRAVPRFPAGLEAAVKQAIASWLASTDVGFGYGSAACGADILFHECLLETGRQACVVLPYAAAEFRVESVDIAPGWSERFEQVLRAAERVMVASEQKLGQGSASFQYGNEMMAGLARLRAQVLDTEFAALAVWDGEDNQAAGGTAEAVREWRSRGLPVDVIDLAQLRHRAAVTLPARPAPETPAASPGSPLPAAFAPVVRAILFADAVGFSRLRDDQLPMFVEKVLGSIAELLDRTHHRPTVKNTWGDGLYLIFESVLDGGAFALELRDLIHGIGFASYSLPPELDLRIGLHAGPVYSCIDPVQGQPNYVGTHVSRAARIEPITPPGEVYASEAFAALAAAQGGEALFRCEYVGQMPQAKGYGTFPTYVLRPVRPPRVHRGEVSSASLATQHP